MIAIERREDDHNKNGATGRAKEGGRYRKVMLEKSPREFGRVEPIKEQL